MTLRHFLVVVAVALLVLKGPAFAQNSRLAKAGAVVDAMLEIDGREQAKLAVEDMLRQTREYEFRGEYEEFFVSLVRAPEYRAAKARAYAEAFTEGELDEILELARNPTFRKYQERTPVLQRASRVAFAETMRPKFLEFAQRIEALKQARGRR
jgi:hypothetical protein